MPQYKTERGYILSAGFDTAGGKPVVRGIVRCEKGEYTFTLWLDKVNDKDPAKESPFSRTARAMRAAGFVRYGNVNVPRDTWFAYDSDDSGNVKRNEVRVTLADWVDNAGKTRWGAKYIDPVSSLELKSPPARDTLDALFAPSSAKAGPPDDISADDKSEDIPF